MVQSQKTDVQSKQTQLSDDTLTPNIQQQEIVFNIVFPPNYPQEPPKIQFITIPWHPNIRRTGEICLSTISSDYHSNITLAGIMAALRCLLEEPNLDDYVNEEACQSYKEHFGGIN